MDKKEKKRDVATFASMMKDLMQDPLDDPLTTLDRDIQYFIYGRVATLVKHNEGKPLGSVGDIGTVVGAALSDVMKEFVRDKVDNEKIAQVFSSVRQNLLIGFDARAPKIEKKEENAQQ